MKVPPLSEPSSAPLDSVMDSVARSIESGGIYGLCGSARAFVTAGAALKGAKTFLVIHEDGDKANIFASDTHFFLGKGEGPSHPLQDPVALYPSSDLIPYSFGSYETDMWADRMTTLYRLAEGKPPRIISAGVDSLFRTLIPRNILARSIFSLEVNKPVDRDVVVRGLELAGYSRSPLVEDVGDYSVRGFIIDLFCPLYPYPVRTEFMGDGIEAIRFFDPSNQRSRDPVSEIHVCPVHMMTANDDEKLMAVENLLRVCEERGVEKRVRQRLVEDLQHGVRFPGAEYFLPYFFPNLECFLDYLPKDCTLVVPDEHTLGRAIEDVQEEIFRGNKEALDEGLPVPTTELLYMRREDFFDRVQRFRILVMSELETLDARSKGQRIRCSLNTDLRHDLVHSQGYDSGMAGLVTRLKNWRNDGNELFLVSHTQGQARRLMNLLEPYDLDLDFRGTDFEPSNFDRRPVPGIRVYVGELSAGFRLDDGYRIVVTEEEIFGTRVRNPQRKRMGGAFIASLTDLAQGDPVVHEDYGIGIFRGLVYKEFDGIPSEVMLIEYAGGDFLYQPLDRLQVIQKYVSGSESPPVIDRLGGKGWAKTKAKVKKAIREMAGELLAIFARRQIARRPPYSPPDDTLATFEATFEFEETPDQAKAIMEVMESMDSDTPMDLLVCGDVGYGKTEVALRAAFRAIMDGRQVAVLVPTTVLAQQHYETFRKRFEGYPINVDVLSRFRTPGEQKTVLTHLKEGKLDLLVATHKLLSKDLAFRDLGLLVVDEEHRFGVAHKEKIKKYKSHVDVLTLTATPIPRTLNLSLTGIRELSVIETPPTNRKSIRTYVAKQSEEVVREALQRELNRGGQCFYIHNRIQSIFRRAATIKGLVTDARVAVAHGRMADRELEKVMYEFVTGQINVLVCTSIIESGLDIPRANTIVIERADTFGLADLYQLRGRVGRSNVRAYAYLLTPPESLMTPDAVKRLAVIQEYSSLGQGFRIAMRDLEIRGAGNILGTSQSGHVAQVGYEMYLDLLEQAVREIKGEPEVSRIDPEINIRLEALIPADYVPETQQRMNLYKKLSRSSSDSEIDDIEEEILDLYGKPPIQVTHLLSVMRIRLVMKEIRSVRLDYNGQDLVFSFDSDTPLNPEALVNWAQKNNNARLLPGDRLAYRVDKTDPWSRLEACASILTFLTGTLREKGSVTRGGTGVPEKGVKTDLPSMKTM